MGGGCRRGVTDGLGASPATPTVGSASANSGSSLEHAKCPQGHPLAGLARSVDVAYELAFVGVPVRPPAVGFALGQEPVERGVESGIARGAADAMMLAAGEVEVWIEPAAKPWDFAPIKIIGEEAGAAFFNFAGGWDIYSGSGVLSVPALEAEVRAMVCG